MIGTQEKSFEVCFQLSHFVSSHFSSFIQFSVKAEDNRGSFSLVRVRLTIGDRNEKPAFDTDIFKFKMPENSPIGENIFQIAAFDPGISIIIFS